MPPPSDDAARDIEDIYELTPVQAAFLSHALAAGEGEVGFEQSHTELRGPLDRARMKAAWQATIDRHPALRTSFLWEDVEKPLQVVHRRVELDWTELDWRTEPGDLSELLAEDRARGFDLTTPPLTRLHVIRTGDEAHVLVWTLHHLLIDGWSGTVILREAFARYAGAAELPQARPFRDYVLWLQRQDAAASHAFWRERLAGFTEPTPIPASPATATPNLTRTERLVTETTSAGLERIARERRVTLGTVLQASWGALLARIAGRVDVVFGVTVSGRPEELDGVEEMVGVFTNTLPVRLRTGDPTTTTLAGLLPELQGTTLAMRDHEHTPLEAIHECAELQGSKRLFDSLVVFENHPWDDDASRAGELEVGPFAGDLHAGYPLVLVALPGNRRLRIELVYDESRIAVAAATQLLADLEGLLEAFAKDAEQTLASLTETVESTLPAASPHGDASKTTPTTTGRPPETDTERLLAALWEDLIGTDDIRLDDKFFDLGGSSLGAARFATRVEKELGAKLNPGDLVFQTLAQIASTCDELARSAPAPKEGLAARMKRALKGAFTTDG